MTDIRRKRLESVPGWSWNVVEESWMEHLELLRTFAARVGDTLVAVDYVENGLKLGQWVRLRRREHKKLSPERRAFLEAIPGWFWGTKSDFIWEQKFAMAQRFAKREGHARVPFNHVENGEKLGSWVVAQRAERNTLRSERVAKLEALPGWTWTVSQDAWDEKYELAKMFAEREGHARIPQNHVEDGVQMGAWVGVQRQKRAKLSEGRRVKLEALPGWSWDPHVDRWEGNFRMLQNYAADHRTSRVPYSYESDGIKLGVWVSGQRSQYAKGKLDPLRQRRLEQLPGWTWNTPAG